MRAKAAVVAEDERDTGGRLFLNYGHTLGHALERLECVRAAARTARRSRSGWCSPPASRRRSVGRQPGSRRGTSACSSSLGLETDGPLPPADEILSAIRVDKKYRAGIRFVLLEDVGRPVMVDSVPEDALREALGAVGPGPEVKGTMR